MIKYNRVLAEINLDHIGHNMRELRRLVPENVKIMAIVKADGYGHGGVEVSKVLLYNGADCLGVAISDEGVQLREHNIFVPVLILGYTPEYGLDDVIKNDLTQTVFSYDMAKSLSEACIRQGKSADIHLKIDTGMSRLGFLPTDDTAREIRKIKDLPGINITGIYSHFAVSDISDKSFSHEQYDKFISFIDKAGLDGLTVHMSNSAAILDLKQFNCDLVRAGIILYGLYPSEHVGREIALKPAMSIKTHVSMLKEIDANVSIGYGRTFVTERKTTVATIPVGYADGYSRDLSNCGKILVKGQFAKIIGRICMDQFMVDVTDIKGVRPDDEVVLMGVQGENEITADELAALQGTVNYEIVCNIGKRVPRVYVKNNDYLKTVYKI